MTADELRQGVAALVVGETDRIANLANVASFLFWNLADVNWVGFYLARDDGLVLGPFHGRPACVRIPHGRGVCGAAAAGRRTIVVPDVHAFPGHIACDAASRSEIVVPMLCDRRLGHGRLDGVLDVDSPLPGRFTDADRVLLEAVAGMLVHASNGER